MIQKHMHKCQILARVKTQILAAMIQRTQPLRYNATEFYKTNTEMTLAPSVNKLKVLKHLYF